MFNLQGMFPPRWRELLARASFVLSCLFSIKKEFFFLKNCQKKCNFVVKNKNYKKNSLHLISSNCPDLQVGDLE